MLDQDKNVKPPDRFSGGFLFHTVNRKFKRRMFME